MEWPQVAMIILLTLGVGINLSNHGEMRNDRYNFWTSMLGVAINVWILRAGGFF
ncbi:MAG: hypothetical protein ACRC18_06550 [Cetobacterium sp.]